MFRDRTFGKDDKKRYSAERASITSNNSDFQGRSRSGSTASTASSISVASSAAANRTSWNIDTVQEEPNVSASNYVNFRFCVGRGGMKFINPACKT